MAALAGALIALLTLSSAALAQDPLIPLRVEGTIQSIDGRVLVVDGLTVYLESGVDASQLTVGTRISASGSLLAGSLQADDILLVSRVEVLPSAPGGGVIGERVAICHRPPSDPLLGLTLLVAPAQVNAHITHHGDTLGPCAGDPNPGCDTLAPSPIADALVRQFGSALDEIDAWVCQGFTTTEIIYALLLARAFDDDAEMLLQRSSFGESWEVIWADYGVRPDDLIAQVGVIGGDGLPNEDADNGRDEGRDDDADDDDGGDGRGDDDDSNDDDGDSRGRDHDDNRVTICHRPRGNARNARTMTVGRNAVEAHLRHGDTLGPCS